MRVSIPLLCALILSTSACAAQHSERAMAPPGDDYAYADAEMAEMAAVAAPGVYEDAAAPTPASGLGTAGVFASPAEPLTQPGEASEAEYDSLETIGADSVDQMLIFTGQLSLQVDYDQSAEIIDAAVNRAVAAGGYVAEMSDTSLRLRVPSKRFRKVMGQIEDLGEGLSRGVSALDVSEEVHDLEVQLDNLKATRARIEKLLDQTKDLSQILTIEQELQRVTGEIDRLEGRMRLLSSQAAFSTLSLAVSERPEQREELKIASDDTPPPPPPPPRTLEGSAQWVSGVGVHGLMNLSN